MARKRKWLRIRCGAWWRPTERAYISAFPPWAGGKPDDSPWRLAEDKAISNIVDGTYVFYMESRVGQRLDVVVATIADDSQYLGTVADRWQPEKFSAALFWSVFRLALDARPWLRTQWIFCLGQASSAPWGLSAAASAICSSYSSVVLTSCLQSQATKPWAQPSSVLYRGNAFWKDFGGTCETRNDGHLVIWESETSRQHVALHATQQPLF